MTPGGSEPARARADLVPARMLNEHAYCPRLAYLEWVQGEFAHSADTLEGRFHHRRVDREEGRVPAPDELPEDLRKARSVMLSAPKLGVITRLDLVEMEGGRVVPVDVKRGQAPDVPEGAWEPERVQVAAQVLVLRENGYDAPHGVLYFAGSKRRVTVEVDVPLARRVREVVREIRKTAAGGRIPPPLVDSPKCPRCSLVGICLPDEISTLARRLKEADVRRLYPARDDRAPLVVQTQGARVGKSGDRLVVTSRDGKTEAKLLDVSHVALYGNVSLSAQALAELLDRGTPVCHFSYGGWFRGVTGGLSKNVDLRLAQYRCATDHEAALRVARAMIVGKIMNQRTLLRRNAREDVGDVVDELRRLAERARRARSAESLLGIEGAAARAYFSRFRLMIRADLADVGPFDFESRNRRPPRDRVNALLSFCYSLLVKDLTIATQVVGFDPHLGLFHRPRHGKPSLALDLAEEMRPIVADSVACGVINNGEVRASDFIVRGGACTLTPGGRKKLIQAYERRMDTLVRHPTFGYSISYRRVFEVQTRLLARHLLGEIDEYVPFRTR